MAKTQNRSMLGDFSQGIIDSSYITIMPDRGGIVEHVPTERLSWPQYGQAELHKDDSMVEAMQVHLTRPVEKLTRFPRSPQA